MADGRILLSKEEAERKADEKKNQIGIVFENIKTGEVRTASTVEHIAAFFNSSDEGPNAKNKQDFGWRLSPEDLAELEEIKEDPAIMAQIAQVYQIPPDEVPDYNVLKFIANRRFSEAARDAQSEGKDYESDYDRRVREAREARKGEPAPVKSKSQERREAASKPRTVSRDAGDGQFVSKEKADANPATTVTETVKDKDDKKVEKSEEKADNSGKAK